MTKESRIHLRVSDEMKRRIQTAAAAQDMSISSWILAAINFTLIQQAGWEYERRVVDVASLTAEQVKRMFAATDESMTLRKR